MYIPEKGGDENQPRVRGCPQGKPGQRLDNIGQRTLSWDEVDIVATLIGGRNRK